MFLNSRDDNKDTWYGFEYDARHTLAEVPKGFGNPDNSGNGNGPPANSGNGNSNGCPANSGNGNGNGQLAIFVDGRVGQSVDALSRIVEAEIR